MNSGFPFRAKLSRWLMAGVIALWAFGSSAIPLMPMAECRDMAPTACMDQTHHAAMPHHSPKQSQSPNHECCKKKQSKPVPKKADMPVCPMHEGMMPRNCGPVEMSCCALTSREEMRRSAKVEKSKDNDAKRLLAQSAGQDDRQVAFDLRDRHLREGLRFEKPVFDLKTDLRI